MSCFLGVKDYFQRLKAVQLLLFILIAPGENLKPESLTNYIFCEELSHPHLFPTGTFGFQTKRKVRLSRPKYFNQRLLNYTQKRSSDSDYI